MPRGRHTTPRGRKPKGAIRTQMNLPESTRNLAEIVGEGDRTAGVERLFAQLPVFYRSKWQLENGVDKLIDKLVQISRTPESWNKTTKADLIYGIQDALKLAIALRKTNHALADEMQSLELERVYEECLQSGIIMVGDSWIV